MDMPQYDLEALIERLRALADPKYAALSVTLIPGAGDAILGVRVPSLRAIGRELLRGDWRGFLEASRSHPLFELRMLHAIVLGSCRCDAGEKLALVDAFLPFIDNWSVCDTLCSSFKSRSREADAVFAFVKACAASDDEFRKRFGLVMLMSRFHDAPFVTETMAVYRGFRHDGYYARMGAAWGLASLWIHARDEALAILEENLWDDFTHNKAIQKLRESFRVSDEDKALAATLRRKK